MGQTKGAKVPSSSLMTVILALAANLLVAAAKTIAAVMSGSVSMIAESAHSWADTGNQVFLLSHAKNGRWTL